MHPQVKIVGQTADGTIVPIIVGTDGSLVVSGGSSGGGGDASAANQEIANTLVNNLKQVLFDSAVQVYPASTTETIVDYSGTIATTDVSVLVVGLQPRRKYLFIQNQSETNALFFNFAFNADSNQNSIKLYPRESFSMEGLLVATDEIYMLGVAGSRYVIKILGYTPNHLVEEG